jgi:hypothetical protein
MIHKSASNAASYLSLPRELSKGSNPVNKFMTNVGAILYWASKD